MAKILVIDDDIMVRQYLKKVLASFGYVVLAAADGSEGLSIAARELPDLIICDVSMPVMDGVETVRSIRKEKALCEIPVIMITVDSQKETIMDLLKLGISYYFTKPLQCSTLQKKINQVLEIEEEKKSKSSVDT